MYWIHVYKFQDSRMVWEMRLEIKRGKEIDRKRKRREQPSS